MKPGSAVAMILRGVLLGAAMLLGASFWSASQAAELNWNNRSFRIVASDKSLADFLRELAASQDTTAVIDPAVTGTISGKFSGPALRILNSVASANGLTWYYDGSFLYIENAADARSEVFAIKGENAKRIAETLEMLRITDSRHPFTVFEREGQGSVHVSGPKRYLEMVRKAIESVERPTAAPENAEIRLFPLKYAWASDFKIMRARKEVTIPGVANVLNTLFAGRQSSTTGAALGPATAEGPIRQPRMGGEFARRDLASMMLPEIPAGAGDIGSMLGGARPSGPNLPQFHADTRLNAVIVRDVPDRMERYAAVIRSLDIRPRLIEIEVTIMDISRDNLNQLGVDWRLHSKHLDIQTGNGNRNQQTWGTGPGGGETGQVGGVDDNGTLLTPLGGLFSAAIGNSASNYLLARVYALAANGKAEFVARPKVLTLDNIEAVLENLRELHVRVQGFQDAGLFNIITGTSVRVTPLIVDEEPARGVMMSINIEDGDLSQQAVDQIPIINRRTVNTQAMVEEGQSLLIAGYSSQEKTEAVNRVPFLSDIPVIGPLFTYNEKKHADMERFYLLTPRLVIPRFTPGPDGTIDPRSLPGLPPGTPSGSGVPADSAPVQGAG